MNEAERKKLGVLARLAQHDEALQAAFDQAEADIHAAWASAWTQRGRERAHSDLKALQRLRGKLASMASSAPRN